MKYAEPRQGRHKGTPLAHTFTCLHYHVVFGTLARKHSIPQEALPELHAYIAGIIDNIGGTSFIVGGVTDHAHLLFSLPAAMPLSSAVGKIKANSSGWSHKKYAAMRDFAWQAGYAAFSVSKSAVSEVRRYIQGQAQHHQAMSFEEEYRLFLDKHGIDYDSSPVFG